MPTVIEVYMNNLIEVSGLSKTFTLHQQNGVVLQVLRDLNFAVRGGECLVLHGQSGAGKSTLLRTLYGNYLAAGGSIRIRHQGEPVELVGAEHHGFHQPVFLRAEVEVAGDAADRHDQYGEGEDELGTEPVRHIQTPKSYYSRARLERTFSSGVEHPNQTDIS